jgi:hypothetical protein
VTKLEVPEGVQAFNFWTILIAARLWDEFPQPQFFVFGPGGVFVTGDQPAAVVPFGPTETEFVEKFRPTMDWLLAHGYVTGKNQRVWSVRVGHLHKRGIQDP